MINNKKNTPLSTIFLCTLLGIFYMLNLVAYLASASITTKIYVNPAKVTVTVGQNFTVEIRVSEVSDLYGWEFQLEWNPNLVDFVEVTEGGFLKQKGDTYFARKINRTEGYVIVECTLLGNLSGVNGNGTLAFITFHAKVQGEGDLSFLETILINSFEQPIAHKHYSSKVYVEPKAVDIITLIKSNIHLIVIAIIAIATIGFTIWFSKFRKGREKIDFKAVSEMRDDEEKVIMILKSAGGQLFQSTLADRCGFSRSKTSKLLKIMEEKGKIKREERGREKIVVLAEDESGRK